MPNDYIDGFTGSNNASYDIISKTTRGIVRATKDSENSTSTLFKVTADGITELYDGLTIIFKNDSTASASGIQIQLNDLAAKSVWNTDRNSAIATSIRANGEYIYIFDYDNDRWSMYLGYYNNNDNTIGEYAGLCKAYKAIAKYVLTMQTQLNPPLFNSLINTSATGTGKSHVDYGFIPNGKILYYSGDTIGEGENTTRSTTWITSAVNGRYSFNIGTTTLPTSAIGKSLYIKGTIGSDGLFYLASTWYAVDLPSTNDGFYYIFVGQMYSRYQFDLWPVHPIFFHDGTQIREFIYETSYMGHTSGSIAHCSDAIDNINFKEMIVDITPVQEGSGDPSPINQRPIIGRSEANITRAGKNLFNGTNVIDAYLSSDGIITAGTATKMVYARCKANTTYTVSKTAGTRFSVAYTSEFPVVGLQCSGYKTNFTASSMTITTGVDAKYICAYVYYSSTDSGTAQEMLDSVQIEESNTATTYQPYTGQTVTINLGGTYYGCTLNVGTGVLTEAHDIVDLSSLSWTYATDGKRWRGIKSDMKQYSSRSDDITFEKYATDTTATIGSEWKGYISGSYIYIHSLDDVTPPSGNAVYPLATPQTYQLTPAQLTQLLGENNVWADSGDINLEYYRNTSIVHAVQDLAPIDHLGFWRDDNGCLCQG